MPRIQSIVLACIAAAELGCGMSSVENCHPPHKDFSVDTDVTTGELTELMAQWGVHNPDDLECEAVCSFAYRRDENWETSDIEHCTFELEEMASSDPDAHAGTVQCDGRAAEYFCEGRRPIGHVERESDGASLADHLARSAELEAAAVTAFEDLAAALERWGAPQELVERCHRARAQEIEHARAVTELAVRRGGCPQSPRRDARELDRAELALDNAIEGCVHEAWAALRAHWVAAHSPDRELRDLYARLASDETEHAQLSWDLHTWLIEGLDAPTRERIAAARARALADLPAQAIAHARTLPRALDLADAGALAHHFARELRGLD
jgi:hypothetical protein